MRRVTVIKGEKLETIEELRKFEDLNNIKLPQQFISFYTNQNPIIIEESDFIVENREPYDIVFFPFSNESSEWTIQKSFNNLNEDFFESKYLSFGSDSGGWQYVISIQESDFGKVYFCRMDEDLEDALTLLANSFEEFINGLEKPQ